MRTSLLALVPLILSGCLFVSSAEPIGLECEDSLTSCSGECVETSINPQHCGSCGAACDPPEFAMLDRCFDGRCEFKCEPLRQDDDGDLQDPQGNGCESECVATAPNEVVCDGLDDDCNGEVDEGFGEIFYRDGDQDGFGDDLTATVACEPPGPNWGFIGEDCDDDNFDANPDQPDVCGNNVDDNCDGLIDETCPCEPMTEGPCCGGTGTRICSTEGTWGMCQGTPPEICDGIDNDCNGSIDDGLPALVCQGAKTSFGVCAGATVDCTPGLQLEYQSTLANNVCDEAVFIAYSTNYQGVEQSCEDGLDNDCDGVTDCHDPDCETLAVCDRHIVFVTSSSLSEPSTFDEIIAACISAGNSVDPLAMWYPIASNSEAGPVQLLNTQGTVYLPTGDLFANAGQLFSNRLRLLNVDENGAGFSGTVWSGAGNTGALANNCDGWSRTGMTTIGSTNSIGNWLSLAIETCDPNSLAAHSVYCISQGPVNFP